MPKTILISGKKRSGKDWTAAAIKSELESLGYSVDIIAFAEPMKDIIATTLGITPDELEQLLNEPGATVADKHNTLQYPVVCGDLGRDCTETDFRQILQQFGNEAMKKYFGPTVWRDLAISRINESTADYVIVSDFRMPEEHLHDSISIKIHSEASSTDTHRSETALADWKFNFTLNNTNHQLTQSQIHEFVNNTLIRKLNA